jgi:MraZ protein
VLTYPIEWRQVGPGGGEPVFLVGTYELVIDAKNRLSIPFPIRRKLTEHSFYVVPGYRPRTLALYPERYFEELRPVPPVEALSDHALQWRQFEYSQCALLEPDGQGRILLPERLLRRAGIGRNVVLIGVQDHLELWNRDDFEQFEQSQWQSLAENRARAMQELKEFVKPAGSGVPAGEADG